jgi:hypothetical protein
MGRRTLCHRGIEVDVNAVLHVFVATNESLEVGTSTLFGTDDPDKLIDHAKAALEAGRRPPPWRKLVSRDGLR